jgi:hypothetical protein
MLNRAANSTTPPESQVPQHDPDLEAWEPPFERWLKLADDLLRNRTVPKPALERYSSLNS